VLYLSTILTEKGLDKNMKIKPEPTGNRILECLKLKKIFSPFAAPMSISFHRAWFVQSTCPVL